MSRGFVVLASFLLGVALCFGGGVISDGPEGTPIAFLPAASPMILPGVYAGGEGGMIVAFYGLLLSPCYWALLAWLATGNFAHRRSMLAILLAAQYLGMVLIMWHSGVSTCWSETRALFTYRHGVSILLAGAYLAAQVFFWRSLRQER